MPQLLPDNYFDSWVTPGEFDGYIGDTTDFYAFQRDVNCYGNIFPPHYADLLNWQSTDYDVGNIGYSSGQAEATGVGSALMQARWTADYWGLTAVDYPCEYQPVEVLAEAYYDVLASQIIFDTVRSSSNGNIANFSEFLGDYNASLFIAGGIEVCGADRTSFNLTIDFTLPPGAESIFNPDIRTRVSDNADQQFQALSFSFEDVSYTTKKGKMIINVRRTRSVCADTARDCPSGYCGST